MEIREANFSDIPEIIPVLKASLGEKDLALSEEIWNFKHNENPFGQSLVLVAEEDNKIIGVRAFMKWEWYQGERKFSCFRAVDTATHPEHQGKGVFKKLTLKAVEIAKQNYSHFIFNTPNEKSRPGYLKMGWKIAGKIEVGIKPSYNSFWKLTKSIPSRTVEYKTTPQNIDKLCQNWNARLQGGKALYTMKSHAYLKWRYEKNPLQDYQVMATDNFYLSGCIKKHGRIKELRITECIFTDTQSKKEVKKIIRKWASVYGIQVVSFSPRLLDLFSIKGKFGPVLTIRNLNVSSENMQEILKPSDWSYSLGDFELF